jgi:altronate dehydratase
VTTAPRILRLRTDDDVVLATRELLALETASGKKSASELDGFGYLEFVPWQLGVTL